MAKCKSDPVLTWINHAWLYKYNKYDIGWIKEMYFILKELNQINR